MEIITINGVQKETSGKSIAKSLRREGQTPCVMYAQGEAISFTCTEPEYRHLVYTPKFKVVEVNLGGTVHKCILKEIQFHPLTEEVLHMDFIRLVPGHKVKVSIPIDYIGQAPGVRVGGKFLAKVRKVDILTTPEFLQGSIKADISTMELGGTLRIRDIANLPGITVLNNLATPIASIEIPRALRSQQAQAANQAAGKKK